MLGVVIWFNVNKTKEEEGGERVIYPNRDPSIRNIRVLYLLRQSPDKPRGPHLGIAGNTIGLDMGMCPQYQGS